MSTTIPRQASVYAFDHQYVVQPYSRTTAGLLIGTEPIDVLPHDVAASDLGAAIQKALSACKEGVAHPTDWKKQLAPLLRCAKVRSWNTLQKSAKLCEIEARDRELRITPSRNAGTSGPVKGYHPIADQTSVLPLHCSTEELGSTVLHALTLCC